MLSNTDRLLAEKQGNIGWMIFNNPSRLNALSLDVWQGVIPVLDAFEQDDEVRVIVLKGAGDKAFISGADISEFEQHRSTPAKVKAYEDIADRATDRLAAVAKPTIAMIRGYCVGGGVGVSLACDMRIASDNARFAIPAAKLGLGYRAGGIKKLLDLVGPSMAKEIFYTARQFSAAEAYDMGLINRVVPDADLETYLDDYCTRIGANAPMTILSVKRIVAELNKMDSDVDRAKCEQLVMACFESDDYIEGRRAFMEKRQPAFQGR